MTRPDDHRCTGGRAAPAPGRRRAFTIVELLVVAGLIATLLGLLLPVASSVRTQGRKVREMSAARQLMVAYFNYATDNRDEVLPGYLDDLRARDHRGRALSDPIAARYPWRIAPYLDLSLPGLFVDSQREWLEELEQSDPETYVYGVSLNPSLGLNVTWVGGNQREFGFRGLEEHYGPIYVRGFAEIRRPEQLLVFASARGEDPAGAGLGAIEGFFMVKSPRLTVQDGDRWPEEYEPGGKDPRELGFMSLRYGDVAVIAYADGHTGELDWRQLRDMRHWANWAKTADYALAPIR